MKTFLSLLCLAALLGACGNDQGKVAPKVVPDDDNRSTELEEPTSPEKQDEPTVPEPEEPQPEPTEEPVEPDEPTEEPEVAPVEEPEAPVKEPFPFKKRGEPRKTRKFIRRGDPDLVGELAEALKQLPDFRDRETLKELIDEAVDHKDLQSRRADGKTRLHQDDLAYVGWVKQMRGNTRKPVSLAYYLDGVRSGPWVSWYGGQSKFKDMGLFNDDRKDGLYVTWYGSGRKKDAAIYKDDLRNGYSITWNGSGRKSAEGSYKMGKKDGVWITYDGSGRERRRATYNNGSAVRD